MAWWETSARVAALGVKQVISSDGSSRRAFLSKWRQGSKLVFPFFSSKTVNLVSRTHEHQKPIIVWSMLQKFGRTGIQYMQNHIISTSRQFSQNRSWEAPTEESGNFTVFRKIREKATAWSAPTTRNVIQDHKEDCLPARVAPGKAVPNPVRTNTYRRRNAIASEVFLLDRFSPRE